MNCNLKFIKIMTALSLGFWAVTLTLMARDESVRAFFRDEAFVCLMPADPVAQLGPASQSADPLALLFQVMFFLFFLSPPIIAVLLFLIWRELKKRNRLK